MSKLLLSLYAIMGAYKYTKEFLEPYVESVKSYRQLVLSLGLKYPSGGMHSHLKKLVEKYDIDTSHFHGQGWNKGGHVIQPHDRRSFTSQVLINGGKGWHTHQIKLKLFEFGIKEKVCEQCRLGDTWDNKPLKFHLDHINGNNSDNRVENLRVLCPNCHSQTDTYCGKKGRDVPHEIKSMEQTLF